jgi:CRISPR-associated protein Csm1
MDYKLSLVALLHDVGKILQRSGEKVENYVKCKKCEELNESFYQHDRLTCEFLNKYLGSDYVDIFAQGKWKVADIASATERIPGDQKGNISGSPLLDPLETLVAIKQDKKVEDFYDKKVWHPVFSIDFNKSIDTYQIDKFNISSSKGNYSEIEQKLLDLSSKAKQINDTKSLLETFDTIMRTVGTFVPAAVYGTSFPDTSLYGHAKLAAALAGLDDFRLFYIDIKGIQKFISNIKKEAEASKRLRGRSFFLILLQQALLDYISEKFSLSSINNIISEPGKLLIVVPKDFKISDVEKTLINVSKWSDYQLQFSVSISDYIKVKDVCFYCENNKLSTNFGNALDDVIKNQRIVGEAFIVTQNIVVDHFDEKSINYLKASMIKGLNLLAPNEILPDEYISLINLISLIVGHSTRNLKYVIEVLYEDKKEPNESSKDSEHNYYNPSDNYSEIFVEPLNIGFFLISGEKESDDRLINIINKVKNNAKRIKVFSVNNTTNFIITELLDNNEKLKNNSKFDKISFDYLITSTYHPINDNNGFLSLDEMGNYIGISLIDGDGIGHLVRELSKYPGRFVTFSILLNFAFNHAILKFVSEYIGKENTQPNIIILYSGGDDVGIYGNWIDVIDLLTYLEGQIKKLIPGITVSGGLAIFKTKYPIRFAYSEANDLEHKAKNEKAILNKISNKLNKNVAEKGRIMSNLFEKYCIDDKNCPDSNKISSLTWDEFKNAFDLSKLLYYESNISSSYLYKLYTIGDQFDICDVGSTCKEVDNSEIARGMVTYAYLNARNKDNYNILRELASKNYINILEYPSKSEDPEYYKQVINSVMRFRTIVNLYALFKRNQPI